MKKIRDLKSIKGDKIYLTLWSGFLRGVPDDTLNLGIALIPFRDGYKKISYYVLDSDSNLKKGIKLSYKPVEYIFGVLNCIEENIPFYDMDTGINLIYEMELLELDDEEELISMETMKELVS